MTIEVFKPYIGNGKVYGRVFGSASPLRELGEVSELKISADEEVKQLADHTGGGGNYATARWIKAVTASMTLHDLNLENLKLALRASATTAAQGTVTDEPHTAYVDGLLRLAHPQPSAVAITGTGGTPTYTAGTDYEVRPGGIYILDGVIADGAAVLVSYSYAGHDVVEALTQGATVLELSFEGINRADDDKPVIVDVYKISLAPVKDLSLIGDDFANLQLDGELLKDNSKGGGKSKYYRVTRV